MRQQNAYNNWLLRAEVALAVFLSIAVFGQKAWQSAAELDHAFTNLTPRELVGPVSEVLELDRGFVEKVLVEKELKVSDLVFLKAIATKTEQSPERILLIQTNRDWLAVSKTVGIEEQDLVELMDNTYADLALKVMNRPHKKKHHRPSA